ncbi:hypothetical protein VaNZ11_007348 [Volvox africanus]|uniref:Pyrrolo-quinoline quinone repeat domain-containing protein n=1 Tax=Volvox africanus TaxID=51714 RepID=A0ABQ5S3U2_9CHLO|nr:hypothetical protein VaNZ11_007348 [Volvox africanus]
MIRIISFVTLLCAFVLAPGTAAQEPDDAAYLTEVVGTGGQRLVWMVSNAPKVTNNGLCTTISVFNRTSATVIWYRVDTDAVSQEPGLRHIYSIARQGHSLSAILLSNGKQKWQFPRSPSIFRRGDPLNLSTGTAFLEPQETKVPPGAPIYDGKLSQTPVRFLLRTRLPATTSSSSLPSQSSSTKLPNGNPPSEPWLVLVATSQPGNHLYAVSEDQGQLVWHLDLEADWNITAVALSDALPSLALLSVESPFIEEEDGPSGCMVAVDLANGTRRWTTGPLSKGPPSVALATPAYLVLRGEADADLVQSLFGINAVTGAMLWTTSCSRGCTVLQLDEHTVLISSTVFTVSELSAVNLTTGKVIWHGEDSSTEPQLTCTGAVVGHQHLYFGCPCDDDDGDEHEAKQQLTGDGMMATAEAAAEPLSQIWRESSSAGNALGKTAAAMGGVSAGEGSSSVGIAVYHHLGRRRRQRALYSATDLRGLERSDAAVRDDQDSSAVAVDGIVDGANESRNSDGGPHDTSGGAVQGGPSGLRGDQDLSRSDPDGTRAPRLCAFALSSRNGEKVWKSDLGSDRSGFPVQAGANAMLPLVVGEDLVLATRAAVHVLDRSTGKRRWTFELPLGQELQAWDIVDEQYGVVVVRSYGTPPEDSHLYGLDLGNGSLRVSQSLPPSYTPVRGSSLPYDIRDGVVYVDSCSGRSCCLTAVDLLANPGIPPARSQDHPVLRLPDGAGLIPPIWRQLRRVLASAGAHAAAAAAAGDGGAASADRSFQYCFDVGQACRAQHARNIGVEIVYVLLVAQMVLLIAGFGSVLMWRLCCKHRHAPYTQLNALPVVEVLQHDIGSEEPDDDDVDNDDHDDDDVGEQQNGKGCGAVAGKCGVLAMDPTIGVAVPVVHMHMGTAPGTAGAGGRGVGVRKGG